MMRFVAFALVQAIIVFCISCLYLVVLRRVIEYVFAIRCEKFFNISHEYFIHDITYDKKTILEDSILFTLNFILCSKFGGMSDLEFILLLVLFIIINISYIIDIVQVYLDHFNSDLLQSIMTIDNKKYMVVFFNCSYIVLKLLNDDYSMDYTSSYMIKPYQNVNDFYMHKVTYLAEQNNDT